jgi:hypothetical protein
MDAVLQIVVMLLLLVVSLVGLWWYKRRNRGRGELLAGLSLPLPLTVLQDGLLDAVSQATVGMGECVKLKVNDACPSDMVAVSTTCCGYATVALAEGQQSVDNADTLPPGTVWTAFAMNMVTERFIDKLLPGLNIEDRMGLDRLGFMRKGMQWTDRLLKSRRLHRLKQLEKIPSSSGERPLLDEMLDDLIAEDYVKNSTQTDLTDNELEASRRRVATATDDQLDDLMRRSGLESSHGKLDSQTRDALRTQADQTPSGRKFKITRRAQFRRAMDWMENPMEEFVRRARMEMWDFARYSKELFRKLTGVLYADGMSWLRRIAQLAMDMTRLLVKGIVKLTKMLVMGIMTLGLTFLIDGLGLILENIDLRGKSAYVETGQLLEFRNKTELAHRIRNYNHGRLVSLKDHRGSMLEQLHAPVIEPFFAHWCTGGHLLSLVNSTVQVTVGSREALRTKATLLLKDIDQHGIDRPLVDLIGNLVTTYAFPSDYMYILDEDLLSTDTSKEDLFGRVLVTDDVLIEKLQNKRNLALEIFMERVASMDVEGMMKELRAEGSMHAFVNGYEFEGGSYAFDVERDYVTGRPINGDQGWYEVITEISFENANAIPRHLLATNSWIVTEGFTEYQEGINDKLYELMERLNDSLDNIWLDRLTDREIAFEVFETAKAYLKICPAILTDEQRVQLLCWLRKQSMHEGVNLDEAFKDQPADQREDATYRTLLAVWKDQYPAIMQFEGHPAPKLPGTLDQSNYYDVIAYHLHAAWQADVIEANDSAMSAFTADLMRLKTPVDRTSEIRLALSRVDVNRDVKTRLPPGLAASTQDEDFNRYTMLVFYLVQSITFTEEGVRSLEQWNVDNQFTESQFGDADAEIAYLSQDRPRMLWVSQYRSYLPNNAPSDLTAETFFSSPDDFLGTDKGTWNSGYGATAGQINAPVPVYHKVPKLRYAIAADDALQTPLIESNGVVQNEIVTSGYMAHLSYTSALEDMCTRKPPSYSNMFADWEPDSHEVHVTPMWINEAAKQKWMSTDPRPSWIGSDGDITLHFSSVHQVQPAKRHIINYMWKAYERMVPTDEHPILTTRVIEGTDHVTLDVDGDRLTASDRPFQEITQFAKARFGVRFDVKYVPRQLVNEVVSESLALYDPDVTFDRERALCERTQRYCTIMGAGSMQDYDEDGRFIKRFENADGSGDTSGHEVLGLGQKPQDCKFSGACKVLEMLGPAAELCTPLAMAEETLFEGQEYMEETFNNYRDDCKDGDAGACAMTGLTAVPHAYMTGLVANYGFMSDAGIAVAQGIGDYVSIVSDGDLWKDLDRDVKEDCSGWEQAITTLGLSCIGGATSGSLGFG